MSRAWPDEHERLLRLVQKLPTDYAPWGSADEWSDANCSWCLHARQLHGPLGDDWVVCTREGAPRCGLLTFVGQAGRGCFESVETDEDTEVTT